MTREELPRENLLAEATALVERVELQVDGLAEPVVVGFRREGAASVYFGQDSAWHFNSAGELRRAYADERLYKAERGRLVSLRRQRSPQETALVRHELTEAERDELLARCNKDLSALQAALNGGACRILRQVSEEGNVLARLTAWLAALRCPLVIARSPHVR